MDTNETPIPLDQLADLSAQELAYVVGYLSHAVPRELLAGAIAGAQESTRRIEAEVSRRLSEANNQSAV